MNICAINWLLTSVAGYQCVDKLTTNTVCALHVTNTTSELSLHYVLISIILTLLWIQNSDFTDDRASRMLPYATESCELNASAPCTLRIIYYALYAIRFRGYDCQSHVIHISKECKRKQTQKWEKTVYYSVEER